MSKVGMCVAGSWPCGMLLSLELLPDLIMALESELFHLGFF